MSKYAVRSAKVLFLPRVMNKDVCSDAEISPVCDRIFVCIGD